LIIRNILHTVIDFLIAKSSYFSICFAVLIGVLSIDKVRDHEFNIFDSIKFTIGWTWFFVAIILTIIFQFLATQLQHDAFKLEADNNKKGEDIISLEENINELNNNIDELFRSYLKLMMDNLELTYTERLSVYKVNSEKFILIGRSSANTLFNKNHRPNYPNNEGFIGRAWEVGYFFIKNLPDSETDFSNYATEVLASCKISKEVLKKIRMKSRSYFIQRINGHNGEEKALLVIESTKPDSLDETKIKDFIKGIERPLIMFIEKIDGYASQPTNQLGL
jgi:hypothetical protein